MYKLVRRFSNEAVEQTDKYTGIGVKLHENGVFLYKSHMFNVLGRSGDMDRWATLWIAGLVWASLRDWTSGMWFGIPLTFLAFKYPRYMAQGAYVTYYAELLPHTEQVCFVKRGSYGKPEKYYVNIHALEKIRAEDIKTPFLFDSN